VSTEHTTFCTRPVCAEYCDDYLWLLEELCEAEANIERLQQEVYLLRNRLGESDDELGTKENR